MKIKIKSISGYIPEYKTKGSAGMDLKAYLTLPYQLEPGEIIAIPTGIYLELPEGYEAQIRPRSGLALKNGITVLNSPGTIDSDYRGEIKVILINLSGETFKIENGDRIAQMMISKYEKPDIEIIEEISNTNRGQMGFGSTGIK